MAKQLLHSATLQKNPYATTMEPLTGGASVSERPASFLDSIRAEAVGTLLAEDGWLLAAVLGAAVTGVLVWAALSRVRRGAEAVAVVRPVLALTTGMAGVLWVSWRLDGRTFYFLGALLVFFWLVTLTALGARLVVWVGRRATSRWSNVSADAACAVDRGELDRRIALEASRLQGEGERSLCIAAIGVRHVPIGPHAPLICHSRQRMRCWRRCCRETG